MKKILFSLLVCVAVALALRLGYMRGEASGRFDGFNEGLRAQRLLDLREQHAAATAKPAPTQLALFPLSSLDAGKGRK